MSIPVTGAGNLLAFVRTFDPPDEDAIPVSVTATLTLLTPRGVLRDVTLDNPAVTIDGSGNVTVGGLFTIPDESQSVGLWQARWQLDGDIQATYVESFYVPRDEVLIAQEAQP